MAEVAQITPPSDLLYTHGGKHLVGMKTHIPISNTYPPENQDPDPKDRPGCCDLRRYQDHQEVAEDHPEVAEDHPEAVEDLLEEVEEMTPAEYSEAWTNKHICGKTWQINYNQ